MRTIIVDLHGTVPSIETSAGSGFAPVEIISVTEKGDETQLRFLLKRPEIMAISQLDITATFHFNEDSTMWIEPSADGRPVFGSTGMDHLYHKIDGPGFSAEMDAVQVTLQEQPPQERLVFLPHEITVNGDIPLTIKADGTVDFGSSIFVWMVIKEHYDDFENQVLFSTYAGNNMLGMAITVQYASGGTITYTPIFNTATKKMIAFERHDRFSFRNFFTLDDLLILASDKEAYAFDSFTGELRWTQTYTQKESDPITGNDEHLIITDIDGNIYKIFDDGRKELSKPWN